MLEVRRPALDVQPFLVTRVGILWISFYLTLVLCVMFLSTSSLG